MIKQIFLTHTSYVMKRSTSLLILTMLLTIPFAGLAQKKLKEKDLIGTTWKLVIDVEDVLEEAEKEMEEEDNLLGEIILRGVSGLVEGIIDNIDVHFEFRDDNELKIYVEAFGSDEVEWTDWSINRHGELIIEDNDHIQTDGDSYWFLEDGVLVHEDSGKDRDDPKIFMTRID